jgi:hypothetical protein
MHGRTDHALSTALLIKLAKIPVSQFRFLHFISSVEYDDCLQAHPSIQPTKQFQIEAPLILFKMNVFVIYFGNLGALGTRFCKHEKFI